MQASGEYYNTVFLYVNVIPRLKRWGVWYSVVFVLLCIYSSQHKGKKVNELNAHRLSPPVCWLSRLIVGLQLAAVPKLRPAAENTPGRLCWAAAAHRSLFVWKQRVHASVRRWDLKQKLVQDAPCRAVTLCRFLQCSSPSLPATREREQC